MNIVLDTNVLVSGFLSPFSPPGDIVRWVVSGEVRLCLDARLIAEYTEVLKRPRFGFDAGSVAAFIDHLMHTGVLVSGAPLAAPLPDAMDEAFLEVALAAQAECLVTGNLKHFPASACRPMRVVSPAEFVRLFRKNRRGGDKGIGLSS